VTEKTCERCGQRNPEAAKFCFSCGTPLATRSAAQPEEERKVVTVLFADLVGFTTRSEQMDPEDVRATQTAQRLRNDPLGLANSLRGMGAGQQASLWPLLPDLKMRVLLMVGERDARYRHIGQRMHALLPTSEIAVVPEAGHTVHVDQPRAFIEAVVGMTGSHDDLYSA